MNEIVILINTCFHNVIKRCIMNRTAQISVEYLIIIGLSFAVLIPTGYFFYNYSKNSNDESVRSQINQLGNQLLVNAESVYGLSQGSLLTINLNYPSNIRDMYVLGQNELIIKYEINSGINEAVFYSNVKMSGPYDLANNACTVPCENSTFNNIKPQKGSHSIKLISKTSYVFINMTN